MRRLFGARSHILLMLALMCCGWHSAAGGERATELPEQFLISPGQRVLLLGDSIIAPGMFSHVANSLLDRLYPGHGITFHSAGWAGTSAKTILPRLPKALKGKKYDWIILNFAHNDVGQYDAEEFKVHAKKLLEEVRKLSDARLAWMSILGNEPSPFANAPGQEKRKARAAQGRAKQKLFVPATKALCKEQKIVYLPTHEAFEKILEDRARRKYRVTFTYDTVHPNLLGNWVIGAALLQCMGLEPKPLQLDLLAGESYSDHTRRAVTPLNKAVELNFDSLFLQPRLVPPPVHEISCKARAGIVLDGSLEDWKGVREIRMAPPLHVTMENTARSSRQYAAAMRTCRDDKHLYFAFEVQEPDTSEGAWFPEIIEVFIDARKDTARSGNVWHRTRGLTQFAFHRDFSGKAGKGCAKVMANGDKSQGEGVRAVARKTKGGYVMEVAIPVANFKQVEVKSGTVLPLDWAMSFTDQHSNLDLMGLMSRTSTTRGYARLVLK